MLQLKALFHDLKSTYFGSGTPKYVDLVDARTLSTERRLCAKISLWKAKSSRHFKDKRLSTKLIMLARLICVELLTNVVVLVTY